MLARASDVWSATSLILGVLFVRFAAESNTTPQTVVYMILGGLCLLVMLLSLLSDRRDRQKK